MTVTIVQLSDTHLTASADGRVHDLSPDERLATVIDAVRTAQPHIDAVVLSGDVADDGSVGAYERAAGLVAVMGAPVMAAAGNHDDPRLLATVFGPPDPISLGGWRIVALDSSRPERIDGELDLAVAEAALDAVAGHPTVLVVHHPARSASTHRWFQLTGADGLVDLLAARPHVKVVLTGHLHEAFEWDLTAHTVQLAAPSTLYPIAHEAEKWTSNIGPTGARLLHLHDDGTWDQTLVVA